MIKLFLAVNDMMILRRMFDYENEYKIVGITSTDLRDIVALKDLQPDVLVVQYRDVSTLALFGKVYGDEELQSMKILPLFPDLDGEVVHLLLQYDIHNFLVEPYDVLQVVEAIRAESKRLELLQGIQHTDETIASMIMEDLGLPVHLKGFSYIRTCAIQVVKSGSMHMTMGVMYNETARIHKTTAARVEKCIRTAIQFAFRSNPEKICIYNAKPTSSQIIFYISERIHLYDSE